MENLNQELKNGTEIEEFFYKIIRFARKFNQEDKTTNNTPQPLSATSQTDLHKTA